MTSPLSWIFGKKWSCACGRNNSAKARFCSSCGAERRAKVDRYDAFISYRREGGMQAADILQLELERNGKTVFLDRQELQVGRFDETLFDVIGTCGSFILVLTPGCLDRCRDKSDWLKREVVHALELDKRVIPFLLSDFLRLRWHASCVRA